LPEPDQPTLIYNETGTQKLIGFVLDISDPTQARCHLDVGPQHTNRHGVLHGGISTTLLDCAFGTTASLTVDASGKAPYLTISLTTNYVAAGREGKVTATGRVTGGGRSLLYLAGELRHEDGTLIANATGVFKRVPQEKLG